MAACLDNEWTINMSRDKTPTVFETLRLKLTISNGVISGDMFYPATSTTRFSTVSGTCQPLAKPDGNLMTVEFNWGLVDIFMVAFTHPQASFTKFKGRFIATKHNFDNFDKELAALIPDDGDTGTGTGQMT